MDVEAHPLQTVRPPTPQEPDKPAWPASAGLLGLLLALVGTAILSGVLAAIYLAIGYDNPDDASSFEFVAIAGQSLAFVGAALVMTAQTGRPTARQFGFRPFHRSAIGWAFAALFAFLVLQAVYAALANPSPDDLPQNLGADKSTALAIITGIFVIGVAPPVEEFFFRGFLYQSLRNRIGVLGGAALSGLIFGAIHFKPQYLVPLAILGAILALLFEKTGSLWPCILLHSFYNALAYTAALNS